MDVSTHIVDLATINVFANSVISIPNTKGLVADTKDFYLNND